MNFIEVFIAFAMVLVVVMIAQNHFVEVEYVRAKSDNRMYLVRKLPDNQKAAEYLASVNARMQSLIRHMMAKYPDDAQVRQLYEKYNPNALSEGSVESGYTSYSVNKGEKLVLCIRQRDNSLVDENMIMYIAIHELAHIMTPEVGHTPLFWSNFKRLLEAAMSLNLYKKVDFDASPQEYCGIQITTSII